MIKSILILSLCLWGTVVYAQQDSVVSNILEHISEMQQKKDSFFYAGMFPTYRQYAPSDKLKLDNSIFYTGLIAFTLRSLKPYLTSKEQLVCDSIITRAIQSYRYFRNAQGGLTFNFWQTRSPVVFPNSWFLNHFNTTDNIPDDLDDTSILWLSMDMSDSLARSLKIYIDEHANGSHRWIKNTYKTYRKRPAYSAWFGKNMPIEFDFCVFCNGLYFVFQHHLPLDSHDSASISIVRDMIIHKQLMDHPFYISPYYARPPAMLYTLARLLGKFSIPELDSLKPYLLHNAELEYHHADNAFDSLLLATSIFRLGGPHIPVPRLDRICSTLGRPYYIAFLGSVLPGIWKRILIPVPWVRYYFYCPAYNEVLYLENRVLSRT